MHKRIALFTGNYNHIADGVSRTLNRLVGFLETQPDLDVLVFGPTVDDPPVDHEGEFVSVPSIPAPGRPEYRVSVALSPSARDQLEAFNPDLIHIATPDLLGLRARAFAVESHLPLVATYHTHFSSYLQYYNMNLLEGVLWTYLRWFYKPFDRVLVPSESMCRELHRHDIEGDLRIWERGVETDRFSPEQRSAAWRRRHGFADDDVVVTYVSRLVWEKSPDVFASVVEGLQARGVPHRSLIVGDGPAREDLEQRLPETVFTGFLEGEELATAYASSDVFVFPSDTETFGNVTLEAMASALPTVCADATGSKSLVEPGQTGFLAPSGHTDAFLEATERLVRDADLRRTLGDAARARAQYYDWDAVLGRMVEHYDAVLAAGKVA